MDEKLHSWRRGVELFEAGEYWECHEALEPAWLQAAGTEKRFLGGLILLAAALHKSRHMASARGGRRNYAKALSKLALVPDRYWSVDVRKLEELVHVALRDETVHPRIPYVETVPSFQTAANDASASHE